jgi:tetratricopeptide (TPR) repeat protein
MTRRQEHVLVLRRCDHKRDALGAVFLGAVFDEAEIRRYVERYLGPAFQVRSVDAEGAAALRVRVECARFPNESQNLARLAHSLAERGRLRGAADMLGEALKLDPLNAEVLKAQALLHAGADELAEAEEKWIRAGEVRGYDGEILRALATIALRGDRRPTAMQYLEEALVVNPRDPAAREMLGELNRQAELGFERRGERSGPGGRPK